MVELEQIAVSKMTKELPNLTIDFILKEIKPQ